MIKIFNVYKTSNSNCTKEALTKFSHFFHKRQTNAYCT